MKKAVLILMLGLNSSALAENELKMDNFSGFLRESINDTSKALNEKIDEADPEEMYYLRRFMVRLKAKFGIEVPWIASFTVNPEIELVFLREYPEGWETYKP